MHHEHIYAAHILQQLEVNLAIGKALQLGVAHLYADVLTNLVGERLVGRSAEELEAPVLAQVAAPLALRSHLGLLCFRRAV